MFRAFFALFAFFSHFVTPQTVNIPQDADTLRDALQMINDGGNVLIAAGETLSGPGNCEVDIDSSRGTPLLISGPALTQGDVIFDCSGMGYGFHILDHQSSRPLILNIGNITIQNTAGPAFVLTAPNTEVDMRLVTFVNNHAQNGDLSDGKGGAIHIAIENSGASLLDCAGVNFTDNTADGQGGAVYVSGGRSADTWGALIFDGNSAGEGDDVFCESSENLIIEAEQISSSEDQAFACGDSCNFGVTNLGTPAVCGNPSFPGDGGNQPGFGNLSASVSMISIVAVFVAVFLQ